MVRIGLSAPVIKPERACIPAPSPRENRISQPVSVLPSQSSLLIHEGKRIGRQYLAPDIGIIACRIAARKKVGEKGGVVSGGNRLDIQAIFLKRGLLKSLYIIRNP